MPVYQVGVEVGLDELVTLLSVIGTQKAQRVEEGRQRAMKMKGGRWGQPNGELTISGGASALKSSQTARLWVAPDTSWLSRYLQNS